MTETTDFRAMQRQRADLIDNARAIVNDGAAFERVMAQVDELTGQIDQAKREREISNWQATLARPDTPAVPGNRPAAGAPSARWQDKHGEPVALLRPADSFATHLRADGPEHGRVNLGDLCQAMAIGPRTRVIRDALGEGADSTGGVTVPTPLATKLIDKLRAASVTVRAGATTVPMDSETLSVARLAADPAAGWRLENAAVAEGNPTFERVTFTARTLAVLVKASRELLEDAANLDAALGRAFAAAFGLELDRVALLGTGTAPEPKGISATSGVGNISMGANGAALTGWGPVLDAVEALETANAGAPTALIVHPRTRREINGFVDSNSNPLGVPPALRDLPILSTTQIPVDETQGSASTASRAFVGNFADLLIGMRADLRIEVLKERFSDNYQYGFLAALRADVQLAHAASFAMVTGIL